MDTVTSFLKLTPKVPYKEVDVIILELSSMLRPRSIKDNGKLYTIESGTYIYVRGRLYVMDTLPIGNTYFVKDNFMISEKEN